MQELYEFVAFLKPQHVIPTVYSDAKSRLAMMKRFAPILHSSAAKRQFLSGMFAKEKNKHAKASPVSSVSSASSASPATVAAFAASASRTKVAVQHANVEVVKVEDEEKVEGVDTGVVQGGGVEARAGGVICIDSDSDQDLPQEGQGVTQGVNGRGGGRRECRG